MKQESQTRKRSFAFAVRIVNLYKILTGTRKEFVLSKQLLRAGTSVGANIAEALSSFSQKDYAAKFSIARKEMAETLYWLELLRETEFLSDAEFASIHEDGLVLMKMISATVITMQKRLGRIDNEEIE